MNPRPLLIAATLIAALLIGFAHYRRGGHGTADPVSWASEFQRHDDLGARLEGARRRDEAKRGLAAEVVAGRMTVPEAAEQFRRLNEAASDDPPRRPGREQARGLGIEAVGPGPRH